MAPKAIVDWTNLIRNVRQVRVVIGWLASAVLAHSPLTAATHVRYPASGCEMVMRSPSQTGGFPPVFSHTKTIQTQTSVPTSMINISCITCFVIVVK